MRGRPPSPTFIALLVATVLSIAYATVATGAERTRNVPVLFMQDYGYVFIEHHTISVPDAVFCMVDGMEPNVLCLKAIRKADDSYERVGWWTTSVEARIIYEEET